MIFLNFQVKRSRITKKIIHIKLPTFKIKSARDCRVGIDLMSALYKIVKVIICELQFVWLLYT